MTNDERNPNEKKTIRLRGLRERNRSRRRDLLCEAGQALNDVRHSDFGFLLDFVIRHLSLRRRRSCRLTLAAVLLTALAGGCMVGPDYHRPAPLGTNAMPSTFSAVPGTNAARWEAAAPSAHLPRGQWWTVFGDAELNRLEALADGSNQDLAAAVARFDEARASVNIARAELFPQVQFDPSYVRQRTSFNEPSDGKPAGISPTYNTFLAQLQAGWEVDLWGRVRRQVQQARAQLGASADDVEGVKLAIQAELATDYFTLRALESEYEVLERTVASYRRSLEVTTNRRKGGIASDLDVSQAQTQLRTTEAQLPAVSLQRKRVLHAIATLCGQPAPGFTLPATNEERSAIPGVPVSLPSELLERRPDIAAAEQRMAAANAGIGVAQGAFYPRLQINGLAGFESVAASTWFDWPSRFWAVGPALELPLFTGGRHRAQLTLAKASYNETVANYRQIVLTAFQEVEDQIAAQVLLKSQLEAEVAALDSARQTVQIANNRYNAGLVTYLEVATAQNAALTVEQAVVELRGQELVAAVGLIKALGGGWEAAAEPR
jgi:multidrug efflux system outer membrane protein